MCCVEKYRHEKERMIKMLEVKNLTFKVNENGIERSIVKNISFCVEDGEMLVITGPNGGGKSTLAKVLITIYSVAVTKPQRYVASQVFAKKYQIFTYCYLSILHGL